MYKKTFSICMMIMLSCLMVVSIASADDSKAYWVAADNSPVSTVKLSSDAGTIIRLMAPVPEGKVLNAYSFVISYNENAVEVSDVLAPPDAAIAPASINLNTPGEIIANGFSVKGVEGEAEIAILDISIKSKKSGSSSLSATFSAYGTDANKQFIPEAELLTLSAE